MSLPPCLSVPQIEVSFSQFDVPDRRLCLEDATFTLAPRKRAGLAGPKDRFALIFSVIPFERATVETHRAECRQLPNLEIHCIDKKDFGSVHLKESIQTQIR
nr:hypothetical transcript [Hymenolepis microstoma]